MPTRTRTRTLLTVLPGTWLVKRKSDGAIISSSSGGSGIGRREQTTDTTMAPPYNVDHPFVCTKEGVGDAGALRFYGTMPHYFSSMEHDFQGYNPTNRSLYQYRPQFTPVNWSYWKTKALANLNPNAPVVDIPLFIFEFKDFPAMLKNLGNILGKRMHPKDVPEGWLAFSFGWKPLVSDLLSLFDFTEQMEKRIAYLKRLEHGGRVRRSLGGGVVQHSIIPDGYKLGFSVPVGSNPPGFYADIEILETQRVWFTANAKLLDPLPEAAELRSLTRDIILGLSVNPSTVWNMIPWSWLIDYFANIGDIMLAYRGGIRFATTRMCVMCTSKIESKLSNGRFHGNAAIYTGGNLDMTVKQRSVFINPRPTLTWDPILSGTQMLNLGALLTAGALRKYR